MTQNLSRREAIEFLTALTGALAASAFLPDHWSKPLVEVGVLPAHAQSSDPNSSPYPSSPYTSS
jgi:hypothetical protein